MFKTIRNYFVTDIAVEIPTAPEHPLRMLEERSGSGGLIVERKDDRMRIVFLGGGLGEGALITVADVEETRMTIKRERFGALTITRLRANDSAKTPSHTRRLDIAVGATTQFTSLYGATATARRLRHRDFKLFPESH